MSAALRAITGWRPRKYSSEFEDPLARNKFAVFALISSLLVPDAARLFRQALKDECSETANEHRRLRMLRKVQRDKDEPVRTKKRIDELHTALFDSCYSADATAKNFSESHPPFLLPNWHGEKRPHGARRFELTSNFPSADYLTYLVSELGYPGRAAFAALARAHNPWTRVTDRSPEITDPYYPASPGLNTIRGGGSKKHQVTEAISRHRWDDKTNTAVFEIIYLRRKAFLVAASLGLSLKLKTIYQYCSRVRKGLRQVQKEPLGEADSHAESFNSFLISECVEEVV
jgi:hypothetical protein